MTNKEKKHIIKFLKEAFPEVIGIYLFGSRVNQENRLDSDYDLAFLLPFPTDNDYKLWLIAQELAIALGQDVDLIDLGKATTVLAFQITAFGERIYCGSQMYCDLKEAYIISDYHRLNLERKEILLEIKESGQIFAS